MKKNKRTIIIGLDGVPFSLLKDLSENGTMPNTGSLISKGTFREMQSSIPEVSSVAWSSIITGANPAEHGIFGFTDFPPNTYRLTFPNFDNLKALPFWHKNSKGKHIIVNVPSTYPARQLNGILISGFVSLELKKAVYPDSMLPILKEMDYRIDVDSGKAHQSLELFIKDLNRTNEARISVCRHLWGKDWNTFMFVFTGTDRLMHFLWDAYEDENHDFHEDFKNYFRRIDQAIGEIISGAKDEDNLIMLSDHGFEKLDMDVYINRILKKEGFLGFKNTDEINLSNINYDTKAFALDPGRIYINLKDKYPRGGVSPNDKEYIIRDLENLFKDLRFNNKKVIKRAYRKEQIYKGPYFDRAPDLVLVGEKGFNLKGSVRPKDVFSKGVFTGKHSQHDAFLLVNKKEDSGILSQCPNVSDIINIINRLNGGNK